MAHIRLTTTGGVGDHTHIEEPLDSQVDGYSLVFATSQEYVPGSLKVVYNGVTYTPDNDFSETGPKEFTLFTDSNLEDDPFPPEIGCPLFVIYRRTLTST